MKQTKSQKRSRLLGMPVSTAKGRLNKNLIFFFVKATGFDKCHRCNLIIHEQKDLSIEHVEAWMGAKNPEQAFFDLSNIAFSHISCNSSAGSRPKKGVRSHPSIQSYRNGCRCSECKNIQKIRLRNYRAAKRLIDLPTN